MTELIAGKERRVGQPKCELYLLTRYLLLLVEGRGKAMDIYNWGQENIKAKYNQSHGKLASARESSVARKQYCS
jgi:hypothetical protein